jgi:molybdopterin adenylyltransferase
MPSARPPDSIAQHRQRSKLLAGVAVFTLSNTRTAADDTSGDLIRQLVVKAGHRVVKRAILRDDPVALRKALRSAARNPEVQAIIMTGGTGLAPTDVTVETVRPMLDKELPGFNTLFMQLSYPSVGTACMLSQATAGLLKGRAVFCLPGSPQACRLAVESLILPELGHILMLAGSR